MNDDNNRLLEAAATILHRTQSGLLKWKPTNKYYRHILDSVERANIGFETNYQERNLVIYEKLVKDKRQVEAYLSNSAKIDLDSDKFWKSQIVLEIFDNDIPVYSFPKYASSVISDLYDAVKYQVADIDSFINDVIDDLPF